MAITNINTYQDNIVEGSNLLSIDNPLIFLFDVSYNGETPTNLGIKVFVDSTLQLTQRAIPIQNIATGSIIRFRYEASAVLKSLFSSDSINDIEQVENAFDQMTELAKTVKIRAYDLDNETLLTDVDFIAIRGAQQFGSYPNKIDLFNNTAKVFYSHADYFSYVYFYNSTDGATITINGNTVATGANVGLYRYKVKVSSDTNYLFAVNSVDIVTHTVQVISEDCANVLKYIDADGLYRIWPFSRFNSIADNSSSIGSINNVFDSIYNAQAKEFSVGKNNTRSITLNSKSVSSEQLEILSELNASPRVYYYVGDGSTDLQKDWVLVSLRGEVPVKLSNQNFANVSLVVDLPEYQTIKLV